MRLGIAVALLPLSVAVASAQSPAGGEFQVNTYTTARQARPALAADPAGGFVVVWESAAQDGSGLGVFAQRYAPSGAARGAEFRVNEFTAGDQARPALGADARGAFVVAWQSAGQDGSLGGIFARRFDASGSPIGSEFPVNSTTAADQVEPAVAVDPRANFVDTWTSAAQDGDANGVFGQRFAASGIRRGLEFQVNAYTTASQEQSAVGADAAGHFVVVWSDRRPAGGYNGTVVARRYDASGAPRGGEIQVGQRFFVGQPSVAVSGPGDFVVSWSQCHYSPIPPIPPFKRAIELRLFDASGNPLGPGTRITPPGGACPSDFQSAVVADAAGNFVVVWDGVPDGAIRGIRFTASGVPRSTEFQANTFPGATARGAAAGSDAVGNFVAAWDNLAQDGSAEGVFGRRYGGLVPSALEVDPVATAGSDGNRILEPGERVDLRPWWSNVSGAALSFDGTLPAFGGPPAPGVGYVVVDGSTAYGAVADGATRRCADCYVVEVPYSGTRPAVHWDALATEALTPPALGQTKPWAVHVGESFPDVPRTSPFYPFVETLLHNGVTGGCAAAAYCPSSPTTREQMAAFVMLAKEGSGYAPVPCVPPARFADVPATSIFCDVIEELARRGVVAGCGGGNYCPTFAVARDAMAVFVLRALDPVLVPPACTTPVFADVPASSPFCPWIEELARRGVVTGCGGGNYCPTAPVTRDQMAVFVTVTFGLSAYGP